MPTGYTHNVKDGITFETFVLQCSRAMGALIDMRDEDSDAQIPEELVIDTSYYDNGLVADRLKLAKISAMDSEEVNAAAKECYNTEIQDNVRYIKEHGEQKTSYDNMLAKVRAWVPPTTDHDNFKTFMVNQLEESIKFDCDSTYYTNRVIELEVGEAWRLRQIKYCNRDIEYKVEELAKKIERATRNHKWVTDLRNSL